MIALLLTAEELADLTGRKRGDAQIRWLRGQGWAFVIGADGAPKVARAHAEQQLGVRPALDSRPRAPQLRLSNAT